MIPVAEAWHVALIVLIVLIILWVIFAVAEALFLFGVFVFMVVDDWLWRRAQRKSEDEARWP